jgi:hypothetical protein
MASLGISSTIGDFTVGYNQACPGHNAVHDVFRAIPVQGVQRAAPADQVATHELSFRSCGVFPVLIMEALQKEFALFYQTIDGFSVLQLLGALLSSLGRESECMPFRGPEEAGF